MTHPARTVGFPELHAGLLAARDAGHVSEQSGPEGLRLYCYSKSCVYDRAWSTATMLARGIILAPAEQRVIATPFPKFFNFGEMNQTIPDLPFEVFDKLDGSLIVIFHYAGQWRTATKGSFYSNQAKWAAEQLTASDLSALDISTTYLAEAIYPENKIVIRYADSGLFLLAAYDGSGTELTYDRLRNIGASLGWPVVERLPAASFAELLTDATSLPSDKEGWVLRFNNGLRLKIKGNEYRRIHQMVSRLTPLSIWDLMFNDGDMDAYRKELPEEFWADFDSIFSILRGQLDSILLRVASVASPLAELTDKEVGLQLHTLPEDTRPFVFPYRKQGGDLLNGRSRVGLFKAIRPDRNELDGYVPSSSVTKVLEDSP